MSKQRPKILLVCSVESEKRGGIKYGTGQRLALFERALNDIGEVHTVQAKPWGGWAGWPINRKTWNFDDASAAAVCKWNLRKHQPDQEAIQAFEAHHPRDYDVVFLHRLTAAWWTGWTDPHRTIVDFDDIPSHYYRQTTRNGNPVFRLLKWLRYLRIRVTEKRMPNAFRYVLVCSETDQRYMAHPNVKVISNTYYPNKAMEDEPKPGTPGAMLFVGTLQYWANVRGLAWFVREVLPLVRQSVPEAKLVVVGLEPTPDGHKEDMSWTENQGVEFVGEVDDVASYIQNASFEVVPLLHGCGTRIKIVESLAYGKPVVGTSIGAYGWPMGEEEGVFRRDAAKGFAQACIDLLGQANRPYACGLKGRDFIQEHYRPQAIAKKLEGLVQTILKEQGPVSGSPKA